MRGRARGGVGALVVAAVLLLGACSAGSTQSSGTAGPAPAHSAPGSSTGPVASPSAGSSAGPWHVVALGDSVTSGGPCGCTPFPQLYARDLAQVRGVQASVQNFGVGGLDSGGLLSSLEDARSQVATAVRGADIVLLTIGANDFADQHGAVVDGRCLAGPGTNCVAQDLATMRRNVTAILAAVHRLRAHRPTTVLVTGYWNVFEDGAVARDSFTDLGVRATQVLTRMANESIRRDARQAGATYVDLYAPFNGPRSRGDTTRLLASDGDHPNAAGQSLIAERLVAAGLPGLVAG
ncbi:SGNH/GDSL hydrolase family protein [Oryzihumus sp.]